MLILSACGDYDTGKVYSNLQDQDFIVGNNTSEIGVYDNLQYNLNQKEIKRLCAGDYTEEEISYYELEQRAILEISEELCSQLPDEALVFTCDSQTTTYYSKDRCLIYVVR